jgi:Fe-S-cluster containining protein
MTEKINNPELRILHYCQSCGGSCCYTGSPLYLPEEKEVVVAQHPDHFEKIAGNFVIPKPQGFCPYLTTKKLCSIQDQKGIDCLIYPIDPKYERGFVQFVIDANCPAYTRLTPEFIASALFLGAEWIKKFDVQAFNAYWDEYKKGNTQQCHLNLADFLRKKDSRFMEKVKKVLAEKIRDTSKTLHGWNSRILLKEDLADLLS